MHRQVSRLEKMTGDLTASLCDILEWRWDDRFDTALAQFSVAAQGRVGHILAGTLDHAWDRGNAEGSPEIIRMIIDYFGGIQHDQKLLSSDPDRDDILVCAWWPWMDGETVSIRLAVHDRSMGDKENSELTGAFKKWMIKGRAG